MPNRGKLFYELFPWQNKRMVGLEVGVEEIRKVKGNIG
jgi:hypothetical protein